MKIATCTVSYEGYSEISGNESRLKLIEETISKKELKNVGLVAFPGGFLCAENIELAKVLGERVKSLAEQYRVHIVLGVDLKEKSTQENHDLLVKEYSLPWFAIIASPNKKEIYLWRQRSVNSKNQVSENNDIYNEKRTLKIGSVKFEILMCGEIFNKKIKSSILERGIDVVIDLAHTGKGFRVTFSMKFLAENGVQSFCSVHVQKRKAMKHGYIPKNKSGFGKVSTREPSLVVGSSPRVEVVVWSV